MPETITGGTTEDPKPMPIQPKEEGKPGTRPGNGDIYCLLVGINKYKNAAAGMVKNLGGCIKDLDTIEKWLHDQFKVQKEKKTRKNFLEKILGRLKDGLNGFDGSPNGIPTTYTIPIQGYRALKVLRLEDEKATHQGIIDHFGSFLSEAGPNDRVWFHYSGHGTEAPTANEFKNLGIGKDQCLMCHDFWEDPGEGKIDGLLADKEIAALLHKITDKDGGAPHVVVTLDCCNSGGGTRDDEPGVNTRGTELKTDIINNERPLSTYFGNYKVNEDQLVTIPSSPHVVITACTNAQLAGEKGGGFFTTSLIQSLRMVNGETNYADLQTRIRAVVQSLDRDQTPTFNVFGGTNAYTRFLEGTDEGDPKRYPVEYISQKWYLKLGAIHGLPANGSFEKVGTGVSEDIAVKIYQFGDSSNNEPVAKGRLVEKQIGPLDSALEIIDGSLKPKDDKGDPITYFGVLDFFPAEQEFILITGNPGKVNQFINDHWENFTDTKGRKILEDQNIHYLEQADSARPHAFEVEVLDNDFRIKNLEEDRLVDKSYGEEETPAKEVLWDLIKIAKWKRMLRLENTHPESKLSKQIDFQVKMLGEDRENSVIPLDDQQGQAYKKWIVEATEENALERGLAGKRSFDLCPQATIAESVDQKYYYYLFRLHKYGIRTRDNDRKEPFEGISPVEFEKFGWGLDPDEDRDVYYFKLIVTSEQLDISTIIQDTIKPNETRGDEEDPSEKGFQDWYAATIEIDLRRKT